MEERNEKQSAAVESNQASGVSGSQSDVCDTGPEGDESMTPAGMNSAPAEGARTKDGEGIGCPAELKTDNSD